jgi:hypothetical protein
MTCQSIVRRWVGNPDEPERVNEPCGKPARYRIRASTGVNIRVCARHANWWRKSDLLRALIEVVVEPLEVTRESE